MNVKELLFKFDKNLLIKTAIHKEKNVDLCSVDNLLKVDENIQYLYNGLNKFIEEIREIKTIKDDEHLIGFQYPDISFRNIEPVLFLKKDILKNNDFSKIQSYAFDLDDTEKIMSYEVMILDFENERELAAYLLLELTYWGYSLDTIRTFKEDILESINMRHNMDKTENNIT